MATLRRFGDRRNSVPRGTSSRDDAVMEPARPPLPVPGTVHRPHTHAVEEGARLVVADLLDLRVVRRNHQYVFIVSSVTALSNPSPKPEARRSRSQGEGPSRLGSPEEILTARSESLSLESFSETAVTNHEGGQPYFCTSATGNLIRSKTRDLL